MTEQIVIRPARDGDRDFVVGLVPSLLEFGSPAWNDVEGLAPGFRSVLADAVSRRDPRPAVLIAQGADGTPLGFISLKVHRMSSASSEVTSPTWPSQSTRAGEGSAGR